MTEEWLARWEQGRTGWHELAGNSALKKHWPELPAGSRTLVPLCGKSLDLIWLESRNLDVTGVEVSELAVESFFAENQLQYSVSDDKDLRIYRCAERRITIFCGDYFSFVEKPFDALYDRGSLVALPVNLRDAYVRHTDALLRPGAHRLLITLDYDQSKVEGPPFSISSNEVLRYWPGLIQVSVTSDADSCPPKFREAGLQEFVEVTWTSAGSN